MVEKGVDAAIVDNLNNIYQEYLMTTSKELNCVPPEIIVVSGDKDYLNVLEKLKRIKMRITLISSEKAISPELRLIADKFISLEQHFNKFELKKL